MRAILTECNDAFVLQLIADDITDAAKLTRMGTNWTKEIDVNVNVGGEGQFEFCARIDIGHRKEMVRNVQKFGWVTT